MIRRNPSFSKSQTGCFNVENGLCLDRIQDNFWLNLNDSGLVRETFVLNFKRILTCLKHSHFRMLGAIPVNSFQLHVVIFKGLPTTSEDLSVFVLFFLLSYFSLPPHASLDFSLISQPISIKFGMVVVRDEAKRCLKCQVNRTRGRDKAWSESFTMLYNRKNSIYCA